MNVNIQIGKVRVKYLGNYIDGRIYNKLEAVYYEGATWTNLKENNRDKPNNETWKQGFTDGKDLFETEIISNIIYKDY